MADGFTVEKRKVFVLHHNGTGVELVSYRAAFIWILSSSAYVDLNGTTEILNEFGQLGETKEAVSEFQTTRTEKGPTWLNVC